jgi:hypothetical protein
MDPEQAVREIAQGTVAHIASESVQGGEILGLLQQIRVKLAPLWLMRVVARVSRLFGRTSYARRLDDAARGPAGDTSQSR